MIDYLIDFSWLMNHDPGDSLRVMHGMGWLKTHLPEVHVLYGVPQRAEHHPEVDVGIHIELCLTMAAQMNLSQRARFAVLVHDLGKGLTPEAEWPRHPNHETRGQTPVQKVCTRFHVPDDWKELAMLVCLRHLVCHKIFESQPRTVLDLLEAVGDMLPEFAAACEADARGRLGFAERAYPQAKFLLQVRDLLEPWPALGFNAPTKDVRIAQNHRHHKRLTLVGQLQEHYRSEDPKYLGKEVERTSSHA